MLIVNYKITMGYCYRKVANTYQISKLHPANCDLFAEIYHYKKDEKNYAQLISFFCDEEHLERYVKDICIPENVTYRLNMYYKVWTNRTIKLLLQMGAKVICYYKKPKK